ncbi:SusD/RagB family nutrient-binding outer membrane lipoprotein [Siphonobacter curvatus]|uniref:SusD/RagB family nutrient-binding outer membrane lipoprotein n=1 Tax=Siphonobacter curvatus TaxID=2094562 RepID=A0A2S7ILW3_9BACT|nr:SusD/RagB family nutrient-binding outer membrane lipoprotein [Siphonobacter curvatus]PQA58717.1 SusD/RagB family nutrient-binding outer membrane lipoprotein [Siphonobacter curvatus]
MKKIAFKKPIIGLLGLMALVSSCSDFGDMNVDPNRASVASTAALLSGAEVNFGAAVTASDAQPILYAQHWSEITYTQNSRYQGTAFSYNGFYAGPLVSLNYIIKVNSDDATKAGVTPNGSNANQIAVARIIRAYFFSVLTDRFGDIPYSEALKGNQDFTPTFDAQKDIYTDLFKELKEAAAQFDGGTAVKGDIILNGNATRWKKFAASLRMILALRLSKVDAAKGKTEFVAAMQDGPLASNSDNVRYNYTDTYPNPWFASFVTSGRLDFAVSEPLVNYLKPLTDPRLPAFADKSVSKQDYVGMPYGLTNPGVKPADVSLPNASLRTVITAPANVLTYSQVLFSQAEAVKLGWITGDAKALYEAAIKASMEQWGVYTEAAYTAYIANANVAYSDAKALELIGTQKWVALYMQGYEAWSEWRRTGYPNFLKPAPGAVNNTKQIPLRQGYPTTERDLNTDNYNAVISRQGPDTDATPVWWDK